MSESRFVREVDGHRYELIINMVEGPGSGQFTEEIPGSWDLHVDGQPLATLEEAEAGRLRVFGEWR